MKQTEKAARFAELHVKGAPLVLYNAWDAGSARAIQEAGALAVATSSWAMAKAQGYNDGEDIPIGLVEQIVARIAATVDVPLSVDFEGGYSEDDGEMAENVTRLLDLGVVGINFEDRIVKGSGLYDIDRQARRIAALRGAADRKGIALFINARTDLFFGQGGEPTPSVDEARHRAEAYAGAGASGFFVPGVRDEALIGRLCEAVALPVNVLATSDLPPIQRLSELGIARVSHGHLPYVDALKALQAEARKLFS